MQHTSKDRQQEVENLYRARGFLRSPGSAIGQQVLPETYWIGLRVAPYYSWPTFAWVAGPMLTPDSTYLHWGTYMPGSHREPNNIFPNETCACANATQALPDGLYGWSDAGCSLMMPFICEMGRPGSPPPSPYPPALQIKYSSQSGATSGATYYLNTEPLDWASARAACQALEPGADLVTWTGLEEQAEVEQLFASMGSLGGAFYPFYWMGYYVPTEIVAGGAGGTLRGGRLLPGRCLQRQGALVAGRRS